ncbi:hypothetical protein [Mycobacterium lepromatosis]|uniref:hypothetical protein n=1 Tax=Mycobacterium lepromatosis TaxID=480418 RepID=UPI001F45B1AF|nr:hypothetical protein [Mycobacterium lepromatosis]
MSNGFGADSLTDFGYPRAIKRWRRSTPLADAKTVFDGVTPMSASFASVDRALGFARTFMGRALALRNYELYELRGSLLSANYDEFLHETVKLRVVFAL